MSRPINSELIQIIRLLRRKANECHAPIWKALAKSLEKSKHKRCVVNLSRINRHTEQDETVAVPGKVLGDGILDHRISVAAFDFSDKAKRKIEAVGGNCLTFGNLIKKHPQGANIKIIG